MQAERRPIRGYEGVYEVDRDGNIFSVERVIDNAGTRQIRKARQRKLRLTSHGYYQIKLAWAGVQECFLVHRLVAEAFIENPCGHAYVNHKDANKTNNRVDNLEWCSFAENVRHAFAMNLVSRKGERNSRAVLTDETAAKAIEMIASTSLTLQEIGAKFGVSKSSMFFLANGNTWRHIPRPAHPRIRPISA